MGVLFERIMQHGRCDGHFSTRSALLRPLLIDGFLALFISRVDEIEQQE